MEEKKKSEKKKAKKRGVKKEKFIEFFNVREGKEERVVKKRGEIDVPLESKNQIRNENRILINLLGGIFIFLFIIFVIWFVIQTNNSFEYENMEFKIVRQGNIIFYNTKLPVISQGQSIKFNLYLRNDPRRLVEKVDFMGDITESDVKTHMVINSTSSFSCEGRGAIAVANLVQLYEIIGTKVIRDSTATCDAEGNYMFVNLIEDDSTYVKEIAPACYEIHIKECEVLEGTERFMIETLKLVRNWI